jgi:putative endonuclease
MWFVYILECRDGTLYTGVTNDLERRLRRHNDGKGARYTRGRRPLRLAHSETCADRSAALRREREIKALPRARKLALISGAD